MYLSNNHHLTYCLNVHPGESWPEQFEAIKKYIPTLKQTLSPDEPFGLGLRISAKAAKEVEESNLAKFRSYLKKNDLYVFTINGFPYGAFHDTVVKEEVYQPDWSTLERLNYTLQLANILATLLPSDVEGSISTVPLSFKTSMHAGEPPYIKAIEHLADVAFYLKGLEESKGAYIHLGLEPEPSCFLETTEETIQFFTATLWNYGANYLCLLHQITPQEAREILKRYIGVCFDCCHLAIQFEELADSLQKIKDAGILISKIHLSAALKLTDPIQLNLLEPFAEPTYLHQVKVRTSTNIESWIDLPDALELLPTQKGIEELRVHFHVPLCWEGSTPLESTRSAMNETFWSWVNVQKSLHLEIETYTFDVLPENLKARGLGDSLAAEYAWVLSHH